MNLIQEYVVYNCMKNTLLLSTTHHLLWDQGGSEFTVIIVHCRTMFKKKMNLTSIDPSGFSITAWGQAAFQGGRNVRSWTKSWAKCWSRAQIIWWPSLQKTAAATRVGMQVGTHWCFWVSHSSSLFLPN